MDALPVIYKLQRNAWMNLEIFAESFTKEFVPAVKRHQHLQNIRSPKALLLIDNNIVLHIPMNSEAVMVLLHACFFLRTLPL